MFSTRMDCTEGGIENCNEFFVIPYGKMLPEANIVLIKREMVGLDFAEVCNARISPYLIESGRSMIFCEGKAFRRGNGVLIQIVCIVY